jgi:hypothetical protein
MASKNHKKMPQNLNQLKTKSLPDRAQIYLDTFNVKIKTLRPRLFAGK